MKSDLADMVCDADPGSAERAQEAISGIIKDTLGGHNLPVARIATSQLRLIHAARSGDPHAVRREIAKMILTQALAPHLGIFARLVASKIVDQIDPPTPPSDEMGHGAVLPRGPRRGGSGGSVAISIPIGATEGAVKRQLRIA